MSSPKVWPKTVHNPLEDKILQCDFLDFFSSHFVCHSWSVPMMKITGLSHLFMQENLHNLWLTKYFFAPLYVVFGSTGPGGNKSMEKCVCRWKQVKMTSLCLSPPWACCFNIAPRTCLYPCLSACLPLFSHPWPFVVCETIQSFAGTCTMLL
jgi:hypothetical protein